MSLGNVEANGLEIAIFCFIYILFFPAWGVYISSVALRNIGENGLEIANLNHIAVNLLEDKINI